MKNKTIVIIKHGEGEYDDYYEYVTDVYIVPRKDFDVEKEYAKYLYEKIKMLTLVNIEWKKFQHGGEGIFYPKPLKRKEQKVVNQVIREHDIKTFLETEFKAKRCDIFKEILQ